MINLPRDQEKRRIGKAGCYIPANGEQVLSFGKALMSRGVVEGGSTLLPQQVVCVLSLAGWRASVKLI
jgi:hypothetical protein